MSSFRSFKLYCRVWCLLALFSITAFGLTTTAGIFQIVERNQCRGVVINFNKLRLKERLLPAQIKITEAKHSQDLRSIMTWQVMQNGQQLRIHFKPGQGDFGSSNLVEIEVDRSAFKETGGSGNLSSPIAASLNAAADCGAATIGLSIRDGETGC